MKRQKQSMRRYTWALAISCFLVILLAAPLLVSDRYNRLALQSGAVFAASSNSYSLTSPVRLMSGPNIELESGTLSVPPSRTGLARGGQMIAMLITGSGPPMTLEHATFTTDFSTRVPTFSQDSPAEEIAPLVKALQRMQFDGLIVRNSIVRIKMSDGATIDLTSVEASISSKPNGTIEAAGSFDYRGEKVAFDTTLGASLDAQGMSRPLNTSFTGALLTATLDGSLMLGENPQLLSPQSELKAPDLRAAASWLGVNWPTGGKGFGAFRAKGQLEWIERTIAFQNAALELDGNSASGTLSLNYAGERPTVEGTVGLKTLDLTQYLKIDDPEAQQKSLLTSVRGTSGLEFPLIRAIDADFRISSDSVTLPSVTIGRSAATVSLREGKMLADIAELEFDDGTRGGGQIRIDMSGVNPNYSAQAKFEAADVGRSVEAVFGHPTVQGRGSITVDLNASGNSGESLLSSLDGKLSVSLAEGGRVGLDINKLAAADSEPLAAAAWNEVSTGAITVDKLDARFAVANGVVSMQSAEAVSGERTLKAGGTISLPERTLDLLLAVSNVAKPAAETTETGSLPQKPREFIRMRGTWSSPTISSGGPEHGAPVYGPPNPG